MNQQEVCSVMHGFAKMQAKWNENISDDIKRYLMMGLINLVRTGV
jgi:hypothetical protein